jgi:hypothetical protein
MVAAPPGEPWPVCARLGRHGCVSGCQRGGDGRGLAHQTFLVFLGLQPDLIHANCLEPGIYIALIFAPLGFRSTVHVVGMLEMLEMLRGPSPGLSLPR